MPPAPSNDNQGLKIAVGILAGLAVVLAVTTYLGFSENAKSTEKLLAAEQATSAAKTNEGKIQGQYNELREIIGVAKVEESVAKDEIKKKVEEFGELVKRIPSEAQKLVSAVEGPAGGNAQKALEQLTTDVDSFANEPNKTLLDAMGRMAKLMQGDANLLTSIATHAEATRKELEASNQVAQSKIKVEEDAKLATQADHMAEVQKHEEDRKSLVGRNDDLQSRNQSLANQVNALTSELAQVKEEAQQKQNNLLVQVRQLREQLEADMTHLESANGYIKYVDNARDEVITTLSTNQGAKEQMVFSVFDKNAAGIPADKPKATIQLIRVDPTGSIGRILRRLDDLSPIRQGDQVYSPAFDARPRTFALIGKIDLDADGVDDREDLKRLIRAAGGEIDYDLPPAGVGVETGKLTALTSWYVLDNEPPLRPGSERNYGASADQVQEFEKKRTLALSEARASGVKPINLSGLKRMLNYQFGSAITGKAEGVNKQAIERLINPRGNRAASPSTEATTPPASDTEPPAR